MTYAVDFLRIHDRKLCHRAFDWTLNGSAKAEIEEFNFHAPFLPSTCYPLHAANKPTPMNGTNNTSSLPDRRPHLKDWEVHRDHNESNHYS
jgi:hypothetical protein